MNSFETAAKPSYSCNSNDNSCTMLMTGW